MGSPAKLAGFTVVLALLFGGGALAGSVVDPDRATSGGAGHAGEPAAHPVRGVTVAEHGLRLVVDEPELHRGRAQSLRLRILDGHGRPARGFAVVHTKRLHVIVARRDLTGFQHLHPVEQPDGSWTLPVRLARAGSYRLFADFSHAGRPITLAIDLRVDGTADLEALPAPARATVSDGGLAVALESRQARPGEEAELRFTVSRGGRPVRTEPYLGAGGHLVGLREGDLAFLHVHPTADREATFALTFPTAGSYRLFLQFQVEGRVHTAAFTQVVA